jgi:hypothetical protein
MNKFKVGDVVKATTNGYNFTTKDCKWVGRVTDVHGDGSFRAETISGSYSDVGEFYGYLRQEDFALVKKELEDVEVGDILVDDEGKDRYVMGVAGKMVWLSNTCDEANHEGNTNLYTMIELKEDGFTFKDQEPEIMELSMDEVAKKFGKSASEIRIKKE